MDKNTRQSGSTDSAAGTDSAPGAPNRQNATCFTRIYAVVKQIPQGTVATYGQIALLAGNPRWARVVGYALHHNPDPAHIPCYRVVTKDGRTSPAFAFGGQDVQRALLEADGVAFLPNGRVDMARFQWGNQ